MLHATCTQGNWGDYWLLVVKNQIGNLTPDLSFGHNLCFRCPNGPCEPILDIYIPRAFQWYNKNFNQWFWPRQLLSEDSGIHWDFNSQNGSSLWSVRVYSLTLFYIHESMKCDSRASSWPATLASPCLGCKPKATIATVKVLTNILITWNASKALLEKHKTINL